MKKLLILSICMMLFLGFFIPSSLYAVANGEILHIINNPNGYGSMNFDQFAMSIDMNDTYTVAGAPYEADPTGTNQGKAYVFNNATGDLIYTFDNPNANNNTNSSDYFGRTVAIGDNYVSITAMGEDMNGSLSGIVYVYSLEDGSLWRTILNPNHYNTPAGDYFGIRLDMYGDLLISSAYMEKDSIDNPNSGVVYLFNVHNGELLHTLVNPTHYGTAYMDMFGTSVSIYNNYMVVGVHNEDSSSGTSSGVAYVYNVSDGSLVYTLTNPNYETSSASDQFGYAVSINDDYIVVSAPYEDDSASVLSTGVIYVYDVSDGSLLETLTNPNYYDTPSADTFGYSLALYNNFLVTGTPNEDMAGVTNSGIAYVYDLNDYSLLYTFVKPITGVTYSMSKMGDSVSISNGYIGVSAPTSSAYPSSGGTSSGLLFIFQNELTIIEHTITFNSNGGSSISSVDVNHNDTLTAPSDPTKADYIFERWYLNEALTIAYDFSDPVTDDITLYANWIEDTGGGSGGVVGGLTNNFAFMLIAIILYFALLFLRFKTGIRIWNIFSIGILVYFLTQYITIIPMVIILIGVILYQLYDTFLGGN